MTIPIHMIAGPLPMIRSMALFGLLIFERSNGLARIWAISRIVGNSANEPDSTGMQPLDPWIVSNLLGGIESLCDYVGNVVGLLWRNRPESFKSL